MKTLYIDCSNGVSGDMLRKALDELAGLETEMPKEVHDQGEEGHGHSHRSYADVRRIIEESDKSQEAKDIALSIYEVIARAEARVHEETLDTIHFHEVGRDQAIANALAIGEALGKMGFAGNEVLAGNAKVVVSPICDGSGFVDCAHGRIPVPVPAVRAMMEECGQGPDGSVGKYPRYEFRQLEEVETEMVTPSGLASLIGIGAAPAPGGMMFMEGQITGAVEVAGTRNTGRGGLRAYLIEK
ncbi:MAG: LarC family nickel insertion protein [Clostridia bacterium]|nr:LarC family nickel insertion protein [Clostridia bacterium]